MSVRTLTIGLALVLAGTALAQETSESGDAANESQVSTDETAQDPNPNDTEAEDETLGDEHPEEISDSPAEVQSGQFGQVLLLTIGFLILVGAALARWVKRSYRP